MKGRVGDGRIEPVREWAVLLGSATQNEESAKRNMRVYETKLADAVVVVPKVIGDHRGWFYESYSYEKLKKYGLTSSFVQDNRSFSERKGTLRGLHCQINPMAQAKLVSCTRGGILDIAVDIREGSPTYLQWTAVELTQENKQQFFIPRGFLHGYVTLRDHTEVFYKVDRAYSKECDRSIRFDDPSFRISWGVTYPVLSNKDAEAPFFINSDVRFIYKEDIAMLYTTTL